MSCSKTQHSAAGEAQTRGPLVLSQAFYHWATVLPDNTVKTFEQPGQMPGLIWDFHLCLSFCWFCHVIWLLYLLFWYLSHIWDTICCDNPMYASCNKLFPTNWLSACHDDKWKSCILNGEVIMPHWRGCSLNDVRCKQALVAGHYTNFTSLLWFTYIFVCQNRSNSEWIGICDKGPRTVLMKDCPQKWPEKSFMENNSFSIKKIAGSTLELSANCFSHWTSN